MLGQRDKLSIPTSPGQWERLEQAREEPVLSLTKATLFPGGRKKDLHEPLQAALDSIPSESGIETRKPL